MEQLVEPVEEKAKRRRRKSAEPQIEKAIDMSDELNMESMEPQPQAEETIMPGNPDTEPIECQPDKIKGNNSIEVGQESLEGLGEILEQANNLPEPEPQPQLQQTILNDPDYYAYLRSIVIKDITERCMKRLSMGVKMIDHDKEYYIQFDEIVGFNAFIMHQTAETCDIVAIKRIDDNGHSSMFSMRFDAAQYIAKILTERMYVMGQTINSFIASLPQFRKFESILKVDIESQLEPIVIK